MVMVQSSAPGRQTAGAYKGGRMRACGVAPSSSEVFFDRLCSTPPEPVAPFEFELLYECSARVFEHLEQHPSACISTGVVGSLVDPRAYDGNEMLSILATDRATKAFKTTSAACAVYEHSLSDNDEFLFLPRYGGNYYLVRARSAFCAGQVLVTQSEAADAHQLIDSSTTRALMAHAHDLGICWRPYTHPMAAVGWGPTGGLSLVHGRNALTVAERHEYAHNQSVIVSGTSAPAIAYPRNRLQPSRKLSGRATTAYVLLFDDYDALFAPRRTRI